METIIFTPKQLKKAAELIKKGELIAFPTETVYGLGADAFNPEAVKKIFKAKGRPSDNPLIIHICKKKQIKEIAFTNNKYEALIDKFWPGPLTLILKKKKKVLKETTGGLNTVAVRMPENKIALDLIKYSNTPIAAPSANISGKPSGTCFKHVLEDFNGKIAGVIKSKSCRIGLESTVIDLTSKEPLLLRPGGVSYEELKKIMPSLKINDSENNKKPKSPGMKYKHYSPKAKVLLFEKNEKINEYRTKLEKQGKKVKVIIPSKVKNFPKKMFSILRKCDEEKTDYILIKTVSEKKEGLAVMNRLKKASSKIIK